LLGKLNQVFFPHDDKSYHFKYLDGLRGFAVLIVMLSHSSNYAFYFLGMNFSGTGKSGVYLFFILSSYLLDRQIALGFVKKKLSVAFWLNYFFRRFLRIYPLFVIALVLNLGIFTFLGLDYSMSIKGGREFLRHLFLLEGKSVFWSIPVEFKYYFLSPLIMLILFYVLRWKKTLVYPFLILLIVVSLYVMKSFSLGEVSTLRYLAFFIAGTILAVIEIRNHDRLLLLPSSTKKILTALSILALLAYFFLVPSFHFALKNIETYNHHVFSRSKYYLHFVVIWSTLLFCIKYGEKLLWRVFEMKWLRFFGSISFSMYLFHLLALKLVNSYIMPNPKNMIDATLGFCIFVGISVVVSSATYYFIEYPLSKLRLQKRIENNIA